MKFDFSRFKVRANRLQGPAARKKAEEAKVYPNRRVRRAFIRSVVSRKERLGMRMAGGYPGPEVRNARGKLMGLSAKESPEARRLRRARGIGMARPRVAPAPRGE